MLVFLIFGTVVGSGFSSGKEIMVFFSRFGAISYFYIALAGLLFFALFYFFLSRGKAILKCLEKFKFLNIFITFNSLIFCASMFAGLKSLFSYFPTWAEILLIAFVLVLCFVITLKGIGGLEKTNFFLMPLTSVFFLAVLIFGMTQKSEFVFETSTWAGFLYSPLYVALNTCMSGIVICKVGDGLTKKQTFFASLFSCALLLVFLFLGNFVLLSSAQMLHSEMPFLSIASANPIFFCLDYFVILSGCFTTLISLCYTLKISFDKHIAKPKLSCLAAVLIPFLLSGIGFSGIVSFLYPICSVLGIFLLCFMLFYRAN